MVILKKIVIMTEYGKSNCSGIVKFENFAGRTSCFVRILGVKLGGVLCIKCGEDIVYCGDLFEGDKRFNALYDLNKTIQIVALYEGSVVCLGSNKGRFIPTSIVNDIHKYFALHSGAIEQTLSAQTVERFEQATDDIADNDTHVVAEIDENNDVQAIDEAASALESLIDTAAENRTAFEEQEIQAVAQENSALEPIDESQDTQAKQASATAQNESKPAKQAEPFYKKIEANMQELFNKNERDEELSLLIPDSKWVRVSTGDDGYYVVGVINSEDMPNIICYGVPDKDSSNPPQSNENCRQWMEIEKGGRGYWMMYQSAATGETLTTSIM